MLAVACVLTAATFLLHMFLIAFWCSPVSANWSPPPGEHLCSAVHSISSVTISTFTNIATDIVILSIPISTLMATQLGNKERAGLAFVFLMGSVSIVAALVRFVTLKLVQSVPKASITHTIDVWALVEIVSSILAICLPSLRAFVRKHTSQHTKRDDRQRLVSRASTGLQSMDSGMGTRLGSSSEAGMKEISSTTVKEAWYRSDEEEMAALGMQRDLERDGGAVIYVKRPEEGREHGMF